MSVVKDLNPKSNQIALLLGRWFSEAKRDLPWRRSTSSYHVWVSEVMLQQTQVATCIPYFMRWMEAFPTLQALASASEEKVLKLWEGLGYYSRARRLHAGAKALVASGREELPDTYEELIKLSGIGEYTAGAILSFAWHKPTAAIDGNVTRVISRLFCIESLVEERETKNQIKERVDLILGQKKWPCVMEALIELGALVCKKQPLCERCPVSGLCEGFKEGKAAMLPLKKARKAMVKLYRFVPILCWQDQVALEKRKPGEVMEGLYEFPYLPFDGSTDHLEEVRAKFLKEHNLEGVRYQKLKEVTHHFTHHRATLYPLLFFLKPGQETNHTFYPVHPETPITFSSGHKKLWTQLHILL